MNLQPEPLRANTLDGQIEFDLLDRKGNKIPDVSWIQTRLWIPEHDHGSYPTETRQTAKGHFAVRSMEFSRPGRWQLLVDFLTSSGGAGSVVIDLPRVTR
jgi:hypothetical protein